MSTILKALKKLEDEKRVNETSHDLPGTILADSPVSRRRSKPVLWVGMGVAAGLLFAVLAVMGYLGWQELPTVALSTKALQPVVLSTAPTVTEKPVDPVRTGKEAAPPPVAHQGGASASAGPGTARIESPGVISPAPVPTRVADKGEGTAAADAHVPSGQMVEQEKLERHDIPAPGRQWSAPHLVVSDILPASGGERMAIVNGLPVMAGTMVENAVVREIHPDRVVFDIDGKSVAVPLSSSR